MELLTAVSVLLALAVPLVLYWTSGRRRLVKTIDAMPGPLAFPIIGNAYMMINLKRRDFFYFFEGLAEKWQPIFRTWDGISPEVNVCDAEHVEAVLGHSVNLEKSSVYDFLHPWLGTGLLTSKGAKWHRHRKIITPTFHFKILENFVNVFVEKSQVLVKKLEKEVGNATGFDICPYITLCTLDIICETAMGTEISAQDNATSPYVTAIYEMSEIILRRIGLPWLYSDFIYSFTNDYKRFQKNLNILHGFTKKVILERKNAVSNKPIEKESDESENVLGKKKRMAFLDLLLEVAQTESSLTDEEIREEVDTFMFEGHDTTSAGLSWALFLLGNHPEVQEKLYEEMEALFENEDRPPTMQDLAEMKYLERVIKESLRLYPSVPFIGRKITQEITAGKYKIPVGTLANINIYHIHRDPKHFPNPHAFNPDNFLPERVQGRHPYAYVPFSAGSRNCIGQKFALLEEKTILSYIVRNFKIRSLDKPSDITLLGELVLRPEGGIRVMLERRRKGID